MKKQIAALALVLSCALLCTACFETELDHGIEYRDHGESSVVRDITIWAGEHVVIPSHHNGLPVVGLGEDNWLKLPSIYKTLILPDTILSIDRDFYSQASKYLQYNEYDNALYLGTKDNPYFALIKAKQTPIENPSEMKRVLEGGEILNFPVTPPFNGECSGIVSCEIHPDTKVIADNAFEGCVYLESITIPGGIRNIPYYAFAGCSSLKELVVEEGVEFLSASSFAECTSIERITLPSTLEVGDYAFAYLDCLKSVEFPNGIVSIGEYAFAHSGSLESIKVPACLFEVSHYTAFAGTDISNIEVYFERLDRVEVDGSIYTKDMKTLVKYGGDQSITSFTVPESVENIAECAFRDCTLQEIILPQELKVIGMGAFYNCDGFVSLDVPQGVTYLGDCAFYDCDGLESFVFDLGIDTFEHASLFDGCDSLKEVVFESRLEWINPDMLFECSALENIIVNDNDDYIVVDGALCSEYNSRLYQIIFYPRARQDKEVTIPSSVTHINEKAFANNPYLETVILPNELGRIAESAFEGATSLKSINLRTVRIGEIGDRAFKDCVSLKEIVMPDTVHWIGESAFEGCTGLESVILNESLKNIFENTFLNCSSLKSVQLPEKLLFLETGAFFGCYELEKLLIPNYCLNLYTVCEQQVPIYYDGTVAECERWSDHWSWIKKDSELGFYITCSDGQYWYKNSIN